MSRISFLRKRATCPASASSTTSTAGLKTTTTNMDSKTVARNEKSILFHDDRKKTPIVEEKRESESRQSEEGWVLLQQRGTLHVGAHNPNPNDADRTPPQSPNFPTGIRRRRRREAYHEPIERKEDWKSELLAFERRQQVVIKESADYEAEYLLKLSFDDDDDGVNSWEPKRGKGYDYLNGWLPKSGGWAFIFDENEGRRERVMEDTAIFQQQGAPNPGSLAMMKNCREWAEEWKREKMLIRERFQAVAQA
ncbi:hypothetical protein SCHPADRAFT_893243 [Schizopora paradoxa]|uniref:Uncharacterized protein n=1 Tax=Schizopora paradoxa TaxID=27342 RepID=A0A0H2RBM8_9AGAM|nr:hypothetical protein SCHPADRAFT_893243 [Schizopora paradoxa]